MYRAVLLIGLILSSGLLVACVDLLNGLPTIQAHFEQPFTLKIGQSAQIGTLRVTFVRVLEDSRCPTDVVCIWAGNARAELELILPGDHKTKITLNSMLQPREVVYRNFLIKYSDLKPYPKSTEHIESRDYRLSLVISKTSS